MTAPLRVAVPKGRILLAIRPLLERAGIDASALAAEDRRLLRASADGRVNWVFLKPDDVPTYVEYGAADLGVSGRDTLLERRHDLFAPVDLGVGRCRLVVAKRKGALTPDVPRVATKYPGVAREHFAKRGVQVEVIHVHGSVELAPLVGLADLVVDIVETGTTLEENGLEIAEVVAHVSAVLIANRAAYKLRADIVKPLIDRLREVVSASSAEP